MKKTRGTVRGIMKMETIPSKRYPEVLDYIREKSLCPGFAEFLHFMKGNNIPFIIISGGLKRPGDLLGLVHAYHVAAVDPSGEYLRAFSECESELVANVQVVGRYAAAESAGTPILKWRQRYPSCSPAMDWPAFWNRREKSISPGTIFMTSATTFP